MKRLGVALAARLLPVFLGTQGKQRLSVLIYHRVLPRRDPLRPGEPTVQEFDWQMRTLREYFSPLPLLEAVRRLEAGTLPDRSICVTFDDGYADNKVYALPVLKKYAIPATVFVSTGFLNGGRMWNDTVIETVRSAKASVIDLRELDLDCYSLESTADRLAAIDCILQRIKHLDPAVRSNIVSEIQKIAADLPDNLMMTDDQVQSLASSGISIGAHTVTHPILRSVTNEVARGEIQRSKLYLEELLQTAVESFAYPNGKPDLDYRLEHRDIVRELGFRVAVSTHWGVGTELSDRFQLPRFTPWDRTEFRFAVRLLAGYKSADPLVNATN